MKKVIALLKVEMDNQREILNESKDKIAKYPNMNAMWKKEFDEQIDEAIVITKEIESAIKILENAG